MIYKYYLYTAISYSNDNICAVAGFEITSKALTQTQSLFADRLRMGFKAVCERRAHAGDDERRKNPSNENSFQNSLEST